MVEWVDWQNINDRHKYVQSDDNPFCMVCGKEPTNHWFPTVNPLKLLNDAVQIVEDYENRRLLE